MMMPVLIKKYGNRRLYRMDKSQYVTLDELVEMLRSDVDFVVHDQKTGTDLTGVVLAQMLLAELQKDPSFLSLGGLRTLIRLQEPALAGFVEHHLPRLMQLHWAVGSPAWRDAQELLEQLLELRVKLQNLLEALEVQD